MSIGRAVVRRLVRRQQMGKVTFDTSMSLDGFMTAGNRSAEEPLGQGGEALHQWAFGEDERNRAYLAGALDGLGAIIVGRTTYDDSLRWWGADGPSGQLRIPVIVVTHQPPAESPVGGVYRFVTGGIETALDQARAVAGDKNVCVMGGARLGQQYIAAGLVDEIEIHLVPVLFGDGLRMFENLGGTHVRLECTQAVHTPTATHLRFRVVPPSS
jgi:dihydrofolate reductase